MILDGAVVANLRKYDEIYLEGVLKCTINLSELHITLSVFEPRISKIQV